MIVLVDYLPQLSPIRQSGDLFVGSIQLTPGRNEVDRDKWEEFADHPQIKLRKEQGLIRVLSEQPTVIAPPESKKARVSTPVETKLTEQEINPNIDMSAFVVRPPEVEKTPTPPKK